MIDTIIKKELKQFYRTPLAYILFALFILATGWMFFNFLVTYVQSTSHIPVHKRTILDFHTTVIFKLFGNINLLFLFITPLITMKAISFEKENNTLELYFRSTVNESSLVISKFLSSSIICLSLLCSTFFVAIVLRIIGIEDLTFYFSSFLAMSLNILCYVAIGIFCSVFSSTQITSGVFTFVGILSFWLLSWGLNISTNYFLMKNIEYLSLMTHFEKVLHGVFSLSDLIYYLSFIFVFIYISIKVIESRKWRAI
ncbi:MAG: ABC transporter permease [Bacteriovoracaceae bacterium]|jgi:ABC-2 type transport system permease protein|nr:ABC transporter permease [Bacteriovoracaceae bacterium]